MNIRLFFILLIFSFSLPEISSQVSIGTLTPPNSDAILELKQNEDGTSEKGILLPRVKLKSLDSPSPMSEFESGMVVFNTNDLENIPSGFYISNGTEWTRLEPVDKIVLAKEPWFVMEDTDKAVAATKVTQAIYHTGNVQVGRAGVVDKSAKLELYSDSKGLLIPRLSKSQRDDINAPVNSLLIWNLDEGCYNFYKNGNWRSMCGDLGDAEISMTSIDCEYMTINGVFQAGVPLTYANSINLTVQVLKEGNYSLEATTTNGISFQTDGVFNSVGSYTLTLYAMGTPLEKGETDLTFVCNGTEIQPICDKTITVMGKDPLFKFTCDKFQADTLIAGKSSEGKTITVTIDVIDIGVFNLYTDTQNGVSYSVSNIELDQTGEQDVTLLANGGTPTTTGITYFTVDGSERDDTTSTCMIPVEIELAESELTVNSAVVSNSGVCIINEATTEDNYITLTVTPSTIGTWTASTDTVNGISFSGSGTITTLTANQTIKLYANGETPTDRGTYDYKISINGKTSNATVYAVIKGKNILIVGANGGGRMGTALRSTSNFGVKGVSQVESLTITSVGNIGATDLKNYINNNKIDIIIGGWSWSNAGACASVLSDFINNKKGFLFFAEAQWRGTELKTILNTTYNTNISMSTNGSYAIVYMKLDDVDTPYTNGVFGDIRNKYVRADDNDSWQGIIPSTEADQIFGKLQYLPTSGNNAARYVFNYADGFFMVPDYGMLNAGGTQYGTENPLGPSTSLGGNGNGWDGTSITTMNPAIGQVVNYLLFGNAMDYIIMYTDKNTNTDYQIK